MLEKVSKLSRWSIRDIALICAVVALFFAAIGWAGVVSAKGGDMLEQHPLSLWALIAASLLLVAVVTVIWWRNIDEAAREAHKWSWYWGGSAGLSGVLVLFLLVYMTGGSFGRDAIVSAGLAGRELELGMATGALLPVIGYTIAWVIWWWRRR
jgi:purine-cytosine permease-like protein